MHEQLDACIEPWYWSSGDVLDVHLMCNRILFEIVCELLRSWWQQQWRCYNAKFVAHPWWCVGSVHSPPSPCNTVYLLFPLPLVLLLSCNVPVLLLSAQQQLLHAHVDALQWPARTMSKSGFIYVLDLLSVAA
jgi:hypothetical protein